MGTMPRVEHRFTGPSYTLGIEEELMIVDAETLELVNGIETMLESMPPDTEGDVKPELMESVLEISTTPCKNTREAGDQLRELRDTWAASGVPSDMLQELSMGMSGDFEVAVQEGATMVRVGTAIFGRRTPTSNFKVQNQE